MIAQLTGIIASPRGSNPVVVDVHGVGFNVHLPSRLALTLATGDNVVVHTYTHVREDALELFGFTNRTDLEMFHLLLTVSGIGPKTALGVMNRDASEVRQAIERGDVEFFTSVPRLGKKNAQKIIIELRGKLTGVIGNLPDETTGETKELSDALLSMGFDRKEIRDVIQKLPEGPLETKLRHAFKILGK